MTAETELAMRNFVQRFFTEAASFLQEKAVRCFLIRFGMRFSK